MAVLATFYLGTPGRYQWRYTSFILEVKNEDEKVWRVFRSISLYYPFYLFPFICLSPLFSSWGITKISIPFKPGAVSVQAPIQEVLNRSISLIRFGWVTTNAIRVLAGLHFISSSNFVGKGYGLFLLFAGIGSGWQLTKHPQMTLSLKAYQSILFFVLALLKIMKKI